MTEEQSNYEKDLMQKALTDGRRRSKLKGKKIGKITVLNFVSSPGNYECQCDCGRTVIFRTSTLGLRLKNDLPIDCGQCEEHPKYKRPPAKPRRKKQEELAADNGGRVKSSKIDITYTPPPPCEVGGLCEHFARCRNEQIACLDYVRYEINGSNERTGAEPSKDYYD